MKYLKGDIVFSSYFDRICIVDYTVGRTVFLMVSEYCIDAIDNSRDHLTFLERPIRKLFNKEPDISKNGEWFVCYLRSFERGYYIESKYCKTEAQAITQWNKLCQKLENNG